MIDSKYSKYLVVLNDKIKIVSILREAVKKQDQKSIDLA